jgi:transcriptional regulator with XRE-family HTH domain
MKKKTSKKPIPFSEQLKERIDSSGLSRYRIWKETGVAQSTLSEFMSGNRALSLAIIDKIVATLDLELKPKTPSEGSYRVASEEVERLRRSDLE